MLQYINVSCETYDKTETLELRANTSFQQTSDMENEQMRRLLRTAILKAEILEKEWHIILKYQAYMMKRIRETEERENIVAYLCHARIVTSKHAPATAQQ
jgi:hypothetical protein